MDRKRVMKGSHIASAKYHITVTNKGPYLVYGHPPFNTQFIMTDELGESTYYQEGRSFSTENEPTSLCRCGASITKPYCDGSHLRAEWNPSLTDTMQPLLSEADLIESDSLTLADNEKYCVYARFCHPKGGAWQLAEDSDDPESREEAIRESMLCPSGRLLTWGRDGEANEFDFEPSLALIEDPESRSSAGLWVRGGIAITTEEGESYEVRNRVVLCRCGASSNKPFCDGHHARIKWRDQIKDEPVGEIVK